jgi:hypothetical protein
VDPDCVFVYGYILHGTAPNRDQSFFVSLPDYSDKAHIQIQLGDPKVHDFTDTKSTTVHGFQDRFIAATFWLAQVDL